jgi:3',5'-cyclic AMP phosphodiesterase CpdA
MLEALAGAGHARAAAEEPERCYYRVDHPGLRLLCCDSSVPGRHDGELGPTQLAWLDRELGRDPEVPAILAMHHHPVPSGITFMDTIMLSDADDLAAVLRAHPPLIRATSTGPARPCSPAPWSPPPPAPTSRSTSTSAPASAWPSSTSRPGSCSTTSRARPRSPTWFRWRTRGRRWHDAPVGQSSVLK